MALAESRVGEGRRALVAVMPIDDVPPLPDLAGCGHARRTPPIPHGGTELKHDSGLRRAAAVGIPSSTPPPTGEYDRRAHRSLSRGASAGTLALPVPLDERRYGSALGPGLGSLDALP